MDYASWSVIYLFLIYLVIKGYKQIRYFAQHGIPGPPDLPFLGSVLWIFIPRRHVNQYINYIYNSHAEAKYVGCHVFLSPLIVIRDLELVKTILVKKFDHFADRKTFVDEATDPLFGRNLNFLNGDRWREVRNILSPAFTSSKMRSMYTLMSRCAESFADGLLTMYGEKDEVDVKDAFSRYTNDVIASCAFGIEVDSLRDPRNEFYNQAKKSSSFKGTTMLKLLLEMMLPRLTRLMGLRIVSKEVTDFFVNIIESTINYRQKHNIVRPDMLQLMMEARSSGATSVKLDILEMTAQAFLFFLAGFDASSTQTSLIAHELAVNPDIQTRVQKEVDEVMKATNGKPTYEMISNNMPYLDAVFSETMRLHPIAFLNRICSKEFELPPALPGGKRYVMRPGMGLFIPVAGFHSDPNYYREPEKFDPERFMNKKVQIADVTNLGFGLGPRMCIGNRFAILEIKALLVHLLAKSNLVPCEKTLVPMEYCKNTFAPAPKNGFWLKIEAR